MTGSARDTKPGRYGPALRGGRRRDRFHGRRLAGYVAAFMLLAVLAVGATIGSLALVGTSSIDRVDITSPGNQVAGPGGPAEEGVVLPEVEGITNLLLVGFDSREGLTDEDLLALGTEDEGSAGLTDTLMLVQLDATNNDAAVLSMPRDLLVEHCDGTRGRINAAFRYGEELAAQGEPWTGPSCLVATVRRLVGIEIHHYVGVDFQGFIRAVDAVGGVTFHVDEPIRDAYAGVDLDVGCTTFDGRTALGFVRARHLDSDFGRIARQQRFLRELVAKSTSVETLANPARALALVRAVSGALTTDEDLGVTDMASLAYTFRTLSNAGIETHVVPGVDSDWNGAQVLELQEPDAELLFDQFQDGSIGSGGPGVGDPGAGDPAAVGDPAAGDPAVQDPATGDPAAVPGGTQDVPGTLPSSPEGTATEAGPSTPDPEPTPTYNNAQVSQVDC